MKGLLKTKRARLAVLLSAAVLALFCAFRFRHLRTPSAEAILTSCASHTVQLRFLIISYAERHERFPEGIDARAAVLAMNDDGGWPPGWASSYSSACPDSFLHDKSIGYVYVGSGLPAKAATEQPALVFFCPSGNHERSEHRCFVVMADGMRYLRSNAEMVQLLRAELGRAKSGAVGYSAGAQEQMSRELAARVEYEMKKRKPNQAASPNRRQRFPLVALGKLVSPVSASPASPAAVGEPHRAAPVAARLSTTTEPQYNL